MRDNWRVTDSTSKVPKIKYFCLLSYKMNSNITEKLMISFVKVRILWADPFRNYGVRYKSARQLATYANGNEGEIDTCLGIPWVFPDCGNAHDHKFVYLTENEHDI